MKAGVAVAVGVAVLGSSSDGNGGEKQTSCSTAESGHMLIRGDGNLVYRPDTCNQIGITTNYETCTVTGAVNGTSPSSPSIPIGDYTQTTDYYANEDSCLSAKYSCTTNDGTLNRGEFKIGSIKLKNGICVLEQIQCIDGDSRELSVQKQKDTWNGKDAWITSHDCGGT